MLADLWFWDAFHNIVLTAVLCWCFKTRLMKTVKELEDEKHEVEKLTTKTQELQAVIRIKKPLHILQEEFSLLQEEYNRILTKQEQCDQLQAHLVDAAEVEKKHRELSLQMSDLEGKKKEILQFEQGYLVYELQVAEKMENMKLKGEVGRLKNLQQKEEKAKVTTMDYCKAWLACELVQIQTKSLNERVQNIRAKLAHEKEQLALSKDAESNRKQVEPLSPESEK